MRSWPTGRLLGIASRMVEHAWLDALAEINLTHAGLIVLHLLSDSHDSQTSLAARAGVQAQTMSRTIDRLEREGYVVRRDDPSDRRRRFIERTPLGAEVFARTRHIEAELFPDIPDLSAFRGALLGLIRSTSSERWSDDSAPQ